jgi:transcriptional regulator with XRE-family HTH domain
VYFVDVKVIKKLMVDHGIDTVEELSEKTGVNRNTLSKVLNGKAYPSSLVMQKIGEALEIPARDMGRIFFAQKVS